MRLIVPLVFALVVPIAVNAQEPTAPAQDVADPQVTAPPITATPQAADPERSPALPVTKPGRTAPGHAAALESDARRLSIGFTLLRGEAERENAEAQYLVGLAYAIGKEVQPDPIEAAKWVRRAADQGFAPAQYFLGLMYIDGLGVTQDDSQAVNL